MILECDQRNCSQQEYWKQCSRIRHFRVILGHKILLLGLIIPYRFTKFFRLPIPGGRGPLRSLLFDKSLNAGGKNITNNIEEERDANESHESFCKHTVVYKTNLCQITTPVHAHLTKALKGSNILHGLSTLHSKQKHGKFASSQISY